MKTLANNVLSEAANHFGTPVFLYDMNDIAEKYSELRFLLNKCCDIHYSMKANPSLAVCEYLNLLGCNCEVSSKNELLTAIKAGFNTNKIIFAGPGKKIDELECAIAQNIKYI